MRGLASDGPVELPADRFKAQSGVEPVRLVAVIARRQLERSTPPRGCLACGRLDQGAADPLPAVLSPHYQRAQERNQSRSMQEGQASH
jgi:hypothetical protein